MTAGQIFKGEDITADVRVECDVCIVGSGAGGAVLAAGLVEKGLRVVMLEEGGYFTREDFDLEEAHAFPMLYQGRGGRATADQSITVLQGRSVGGSTTVNWTTCFRTPDRILAHWAEHHGVQGLDSKTLAPHYDAVEKRLSIAPWHEDNANANNKVLYDGCRKLGWEVAPLRRNVKGCGNTGYCGVGCPLNAKQAMHMTYLPDAVAGGMNLYADTRAERFVVEGGRVKRIDAVVLNQGNGVPTGRKVTVKCKVAVSSCGAINGPALLLRSGLNGNGRVGKRTMLHPVVAIPAIYPHEIAAWAGAPQAAGSHQFVERGPGKIGFFLETTPLQPMLAALGGGGIFGAQQQAFMGKLKNIGAVLALAVDGLLPGEEGGTVTLRSDGRIRLDYPIGDALKEAFATMHETIAKISFAAGAVEMMSTHTDPVQLTSAADIPKLAAAPYGSLKHMIYTAHQMGGCAMGGSAETSVVNSQLRHHEVANLFVVDGSVFPTALGVNPSLSIYGLAHLARDWVAAAV